MTPVKESACGKTRFAVSLLLPRMMLIIPSCRTKPETIGSIRMDFPHGETQPTVRKGGEARLYHRSRQERLTVASGSSA